MISKLSSLRVTFLSRSLFLSLVMAIAFTSVVTFQVKAQDTHSISVTIEGIKGKDGGHMLIAVLKDSVSARKEFPKADIDQDIAAKRRLPVNGDTIQTTFKGIADGVYAIVVVHDANSNGKIDFNFLRIPTEGAGFSANPKMFFGPPDYEDAMFKVERSDVDISINMVYVIS